MSEKIMFYLYHFLGVGLILIGASISIYILIGGAVIIVTNAIMMGILCNIVFK